MMNKKEVININKETLAEEEIRLKSEFKKAADFPI